jgi:hypothetical protein
MSKEIVHNWNHTDQQENKEYNKFYRIQSSLLMGTANSKEA